MPSLNSIRSIPVFLLVCLLAFAFTASTLQAKETERDTKRKTAPAQVKKDETRKATPANTAQKNDSKPAAANTSTSPRKAAPTTSTPPAVQPADVTPAVGTRQPSSVNAGEQIKWQVIASGGLMNGSSTNYRMSGTIGQTAVGPASSTNYQLNQGFWQNFSTGGSASCCVGQTGDVNADGSQTLTDLTQLVNMLFVTFVQVACTPAANTSGDAGCALTLTDLTALVNKLFVTFAPTADCTTFDNSLCP